MRVYITLGQQHKHTVNGTVFDKDCVAMFEAENEEAGRKLAFKFFGNKWHQSYDENEWDENKLMWYPRGVIGVNEIVS